MNDDSSSELILSVEDALVLLGGKPFFEDLTFHIHEGRKIALVGRNGAGKTTLMNLITGDRELDDGRRWELKGTTVGYMRQHVEPRAGELVKDFVFEGMDKGAEQWEYDYRIEMVVQPLGLNPDDILESLSGGMLRRAALARALVEEPDILLLDEPTNHMDLGIIEWLENYLQGYRGAVICVSHDRTFLARITDRVFWLDRGELKISPYGFARFEEWSQELLGQEGRELHNREKKVEQELEWANRGVKARVKRNVRRVSQARDEKEKLEADKSSYRRATSKIVLDSPQADETSMKVAEFFNVNKSFLDPVTGEKKIILDKFNLLVRKRDRIGLLGKNGAGKTTLLKLLIGELTPDSGTIKMANDLSFGYFDQKRETLDPEKTLQENLCPVGADHLDVRGKSRHVCGYLKDFLFEPEDAWRQAKTLSGGQMNRLMLAKVLADPGSFLILDEPTNDLDMDTLDMLESILDAYEGTLFVVSHDRDFMDRIVNKMLVFEGDGKVEMIVGGYSDYLHYKKAQEKSEDNADTSADKNKKPSQKGGGAVKKEEGKARKNSGALTFKLKHELQKLPDKIKKLEAQRSTLAEKMKDPDLYKKDKAAFLELADKLEEAERALDVAETRWLELEEMRVEAEGG